MDTSIADDSNQDAVEDDVKNGESESETNLVIKSEVNADDSNGTGKEPEEESKHSPSKIPALDDDSTKSVTKEGCNKEEKSKLKVEVGSDCYDFINSPHLNIINSLLLFPLL